jgi:uncharacterized protein YbjT (DUF2867 family)
MADLVTGASGNVGREVVRALRARDRPVRAATRAGTPPAGFEGDPGVAGTTLDFRDPSSYAEGVRGCESVFLLRPPAIANVRETLNRFIDVARGEGVAQIVFLSVAGAERMPVVPHHATELHLAGSGGSWTILRPGFFAQNLQDAYRQDLVQKDRLYVPAGRGHVAFVDVRDVAEVAALAMLRPELHHGQGYTLTGPEAVPFTEAARILTEELERPIGYHPASIPGYMHHLHRRGLSWGQTLVQTALHVGIRFGQAANVDPTLQRLLGRPGRTLREYVRDHAGVWKRT